MVKVDARSAPFTLLRDKLIQKYNLFPTKEGENAVEFNDIIVSFSKAYRTFSLKKGKQIIHRVDIFDLGDYDPEMEYLSGMIAGLVYRKEIINWSKLKRN